MFPDQIYGLSRPKISEPTQYYMRTKGGKQYLNVGRYGATTFKDSPLGAWHTNKALAQSMIKGECSIFPEFKPTEPLELVKVSSIPSVLYR